MIALAAPVLALNLGFPDDGTKPESRTERRAYDLIADGFGPGANGPLVIAVDISHNATVVAPLAATMTADPGITSVGEPTIDLTAGVATLMAQPTSSPQDAATQETVARLRTEVFPTAPRRPPMSAGRQPPSPTSATGCRSGCHASCWPCCWCRRRRSC